MALPSTESFEKFLSIIINSVKMANLRWEQENLPEVMRLEEEKKIFKQDLDQKLKRRQQEFDLQMKELQIAGEYRINDFKEYLEALDKVKSDIRKSYQGINLPLVLQIHHHMKQLFIQMWSPSELSERKKLEQKLFDLLEAVNEDLLLSESVEDKRKLIRPERTMRLIQDGE
jgi:hypothetical protein